MTIGRLLLLVVLRSCQLEFGRLHYIGIRIFLRIPWRDPDLFNDAASAHRCSQHFHESVLWRLALYVGRLWSKHPHCCPDGLGDQGARCDLPLCRLLYVSREHLFLFIYLCIIWTVCLCCVLIVSLLVVLKLEHLTSCYLFLLFAYLPSPWKGLLWSPSAWVGFTC